MSQVKALADAINDFVVGCKDDGIWEPIKAACILAGWNNLNGILAPLKGPAPTNFNFVGTDYNRVTGLRGDGSTKYLDSNRRANEDPQNDFHSAAYITEYTPGGDAISSGPDSGDSLIAISSTRGTVIFRSRTTTNTVFTGGEVDILGLVGHTRNSPSQYTARIPGQNLDSSVASQAPSNNFTTPFARGGTAQYTENRLAFYSIGEHLNLAQLEARVATLLSDIGAAI